MAEAQFQSIPTHLAPAPPVAAPPRDKRGSAVMIAAPFLSMLIPGLGHLAIGERRKGSGLLAVTAAITLVVLAVLPRNPFEALSLAVQPRILVLVMIANVGLFGFRLFAMLDVFRLIRGRNHPQRSIAVLILMLSIALAATPHVALGYYDLVTYRALDQVFRQETTMKTPASVPTDVELTRPIQLAPGVTAEAPPVTIQKNEVGP